MSEKDQNAASNAGTPPEFNDANFQSVLNALLDAYQPILETQLKLARDVKGLEQQAAAAGSNFEADFATAQSLFGKFLTEDIALRLIPAKNRDTIGSIENWRLCLEQIRCCFIFGWLVCRGPRTFRSWAYYAYRYWLCVRQVLGTPVSNPPTVAELADYRTLVDALANAWKPYLTDQLATVEFPDGIPEEVVKGEINGETGEVDTCAIFERLMTTAAGQALVGDANFTRATANNTYWLCRCWSVCSLCFGCCLARAANFTDVVWCLVYYFRCIADCFRPLSCELTEPTGCVIEESFPSVGVFRGVKIEGTATGFDCNHYILEWRQDGIGPWQSSGIVYPGGAAQGSCGVVGGLLGYLSTFPLVASGLVEIQLCVYSSDKSVAPCCRTIFFELQRNLVWITGIEGIQAATPPGVFDPTAQLTDGSGNVRSFGTALRIFGSAVVGGCSGTTIKRYTLSYQQGFTTTTAGTWTQFWQVNYNTPFQIDTNLNYVFEHPLTNLWTEMDWSFFDPFPLPGHLVCEVVDDYLQDAYWSTQVPEGGFPVAFPNPPVSCGEAATSSWASTPLASPNCQSGRYTLLLTVEDTASNITQNLRQVWFDNKQIYGHITNIGTVPACTTIDISSFAPSNGDCSVPWPAPLNGLAFDELIEEHNHTAPSDNYGGYSVSIMKAGGSWHSIPIPGPGAPPWPGPYVSTSRVGQPGARCPTAVPSFPFPPASDGILALIDLRMLDAVCNTNPAFADLVLQRGECCGFIVELSVWDTSICPSLSGDRHEIDFPIPFCICNDLPAQTGA